MYRVLKISLWDIHFRSHFRFALPHFWFCCFRQNLDTLSMYLSGTVCKIYCFNFFPVLEIWSAKHSQHCHTHTHRPISKKQFFWTEGTSKHINPVKTRHRKFWQKTTLPLPYSSRVTEVKVSQRSGPHGLRARRCSDQTIKISSRKLDLGSFHCKYNLEKKSLKIRKKVLAAQLPEKLR